jgi:aspartyl-tRNA(Asn)/glutamyl-tRNA(Gln) amidotransferase subunit B
MRGAVIGLEIHVQLGTRSRLFSSCARAADTSAAPNSFTDPVTLGLPGTLPVPNREAVALALRLGVAFGCRVARRSEFDRKHYFYPDLPRNFQITQERQPLLSGGAIPVADGEDVALIRCHLEEDAGRSIHAEGRTRVDFNRAGVGLLEIVTEPVLHAPDEAAAALTSVRELVRWLGVSAGNLEEGQIRCDANVSLAGHGARVELKNLNSISGVARAIAGEIRRQRDLVDAGEEVVPQTRGWDDERGRSFAQRGKEDLVDYRFLPEPDLGCLVVDAAWVEEVRRDLPELPGAVRARWCAAGMGAEAADVLSANRDRARWADAMLDAGAPADALGRWGAAELLRRARDRGVDLDRLPWAVSALAGLIAEAARGGYGHSVAREMLDAAADGAALEALMRARPPGTGPDVDEMALRALLARYPDQVAHYRSGKTGLLGWFVAEARKSLPGSADPATLAERLRRLLSGDDR